MGYSVEGLASAFAKGLNVMEFDCHSLTDGNLGVIHDAPVSSIANGTGDVTTFNKETFTALRINPSLWVFPSPGTTYRPFTLDQALATYKGQIIAVPEAKTGANCGLNITNALLAAGIRKDQALVQSFSLANLAPAVAAGYPAMVLGGGTASIATYLAAGIEWVGIDHTAYADADFTAFRDGGMKVVGYTVNKRYARDRLLALGVSGIFTDDSTYLSRNTPVSTTDQFAEQRWPPGQIAVNSGSLEPQRGTFTAPDYWGFTSTGTSFVLQGWACPIKGDVAANDFTIDLSIKFGTVADSSRWASMFISDASRKDAGYQDTGGTTEGAVELGYHILFRKNGTLQIYKRSPGTAVIAQVVGAAIANEEEVAFRIRVTPTTIAAHRLDGSGNIVNTATANDASYRGGYFHLGRSGAPVMFRKITVS